VGGRCVAPPLVEGKHVHVPETTWYQLYQVRSTRPALPDNGLALPRAVTIEEVTDHQRNFS
jgi:hypothetical protein